MVIHARMQPSAASYTTYDTHRYYIHSRPDCLPTKSHNIRLPDKQHNTTRNIDINKSIIYDGSLLVHDKSFEHPQAAFVSELSEVKCFYFR